MTLTPAEVAYFAARLKPPFWLRGHGLFAHYLRDVLGRPDLDDDDARAMAARIWPRERDADEALTEL